jgi:type II secretory pathway component PulK
MTRNRGFALLAVLWVVVALSALSAAAVTRARAGASVSGDRVKAMRARWAAEGCLAMALSRLDSMLASHAALTPLSSDSIVLANGARCTMTAYDPASRINIDSIRPDIHARFDSIVAATGAGPSALDTLTTQYGDGRVNVNLAAAPVVAALPGFTDEAVRAVADARTWHRPVQSLEEFTRRLTPSAREGLSGQYIAAIAVVPHHSPRSSQRRVGRRGASCLDSGSSGRGRGRACRHDSSKDAVTCESAS